MCFLKRNDAVMGTILFSLQKCLREVYLPEVNSRYHSLVSSGMFLDSQCILLKILDNLADLHFIEQYFVCGPSHESESSLGGENSLLQLAHFFMGY